MKVAIKRRAVEKAKKMSKWSINRAPDKPTVSRKQTVTESRLKAPKRKRISADLL